MAASRNGSVSTTVTSSTSGLSTSCRTARAPTAPAPMTRARIRWRGCEGRGSSQVRARELAPAAALRRRPAGAAHAERQPRRARRDRGRRVLFAGWPSPHSYQAAHRAMAVAGFHDGHGPIAGHASRHPGERPGRRRRPRRRPPRRPDGRGPRAAAPGGSSRTRSSPARRAAPRAANGRGRGARSAGRLRAACAGARRAGRASLRTAGTPDGWGAARR